MYAAVLGLVFIATVLWAPEGIMGIAGRVRARVARARNAPA
jgi:ABC-type branched-subunit amino acid transport system permease subunit